MELEWKDDLAAEVPLDVVSWLRGQYATHMEISKVLRRCISLGFGVTHFPVIFGQARAVAY